MEKKDPLWMALPLGRDGFKPKERDNYILFSCNIFNIILQYGLAYGRQVELVDNTYTHCSKCYISYVTERLKGV